VFVAIYWLEPVEIWLAQLMESSLFKIIEQ